jgi:hypothetical protein
MKRLVGILIILSCGSCGTPNDTDISTDLYSLSCVEVTCQGANETTMPDDKTFVCSWECTEYNGAESSVTVTFKVDCGCWTLAKEEVTDCG